MPDAVNPVLVIEFRISSIIALGRESLVKGVLIRLYVTRAVPVLRRDLVDPELRPERRRIVKARGPGQALLVERRVRPVGRVRRSELRRRA